MLELPEDFTVLIEGGDDLEFVSTKGKRSLASLKHKAVGDKITDLATDFWKSLRIWLERYANTGKVLSPLRFFLFTTADVSERSFLRFFLQKSPTLEEPLIALVEAAISSSTSKIMSDVRPVFEHLSSNEKEDFISRITIFDKSPRITDVPQLIMDQHLRTIPRSSRSQVLERLEGWWHNVTIKLLSGERTEAISGFEVSDKLAAIAEEYKSDNLPITFRNSRPADPIDAANDPRIFVRQLRFLNLSASRIQHAIIDYFRAFEQRSSWARENLLISGEMEEYEDLLVEEWSRFKEVAFEHLSDESEEDHLQAAGRELLKWAEFETERLRIRERVTEPYVIRGAFHILANDRPTPRIYWHPKFVEKIENVLGAAS